MAATRRGALAALVLVPAAALPAAADPMSLFGMAEEVDEADHGLIAAYGLPESGPGSEGREAAAEAAHERLNGVLRQLAATPASTAEDIMVKFFVACRDGEQGDFTDAELELIHAAELDVARCFPKLHSVFFV